MAPPRKPPPLSSFDPRFKELLLRGSRERFEISTANRNAAMALRHRINMFRKSFRDHHGDAGRIEWEPLYNCVVTLSKEKVILAPRDSQFDEALATVPGLTLPSLPGGGDALLDEIEKKVKDG